MELLFLGTGAVDWDAELNYLGDEDGLQRRNSSMLVNNETTLHYSISDGVKKIFYGCDGSWILPKSAEQLGGNVFNCMIMDATFGNDAKLYRIPGNQIFFYHNNPTLLQMLRSAFLDNRCANEKTIFVGSHLSKTYYPTAADAHKILSPLGYLPAYDGMRLLI